MGGGGGGYTVLGTRRTIMILVCSHFARTFEWLDDRKVSKKLTKVPAKQFIDTALSHIQKQLRDETIFPTKFG